METRELKATELDELLELYSHMHDEDDPLPESNIIEVTGEKHTISAGEFYCFHKGLYHSIIKVYPPIESFMIRAPSIEDKIYKT